MNFQVGTFVPISISIIAATWQCKSKKAAFGFCMCFKTIIVLKH